MTVEAATIISQLNPAYPGDADSLAEGDQHIKLIKLALQGTFPNIKAPVTITDADLNACIGLDAFVNGVNAGSLKTVGVQVLTGSLTTTGPGNSLNSASIQKNGLELLPSGLIMAWFGSLTNIPGGWVLCDGNNYTPDLRGLAIVGAGGKYLPGQVIGSAIQNVATDAQGGHAHGGGVLSAGGHTHAAYTDQQGAHSHSGATGGHSLSAAELAQHSHTLELPSGPGVAGSSGGAWVTGSGTQTVTTDATGSGIAHTHGIVQDGNHAHNVGVYGVGDHQHSITSDGVHQHNISVSTISPSRALCYIMKT